MATMITPTASAFAAFPGSGRLFGHDEPSSIFSLDSLSNFSSAFLGDEEDSCSSSFNDELELVWSAANQATDGGVAPLYHAPRPVLASVPSFASVFAVNDPVEAHEFLVSHQHGLPPPSPPPSPNAADGDDADERPQGTVRVSEFAPPAAVAAATQAAASALRNKWLTDAELATAPLPVMSAEEARIAEQLERVERLERHMAAAQASGAGQQPLAAYERDDASDEMYAEFDEDAEWSAESKDKKRPRSAAGAGEPWSDEDTPLVRSHKRARAAVNPPSSADTSCDGESSTAAGAIAAAYAAAQVAAAAAHLQQHHPMAGVYGVEQSVRKTAATAATAGKFGGKPLKRPGEMKDSEFVEMSSEELELYMQALAAEKELTSDEQKAFKRQRRLIKNRESAQLSRMRRKAYMDELERTVDRMQADKRALAAEVASQDRANDALAAQLAQLIAMASQRGVAVPARAHQLAAPGAAARQTAPSTPAPAAAPTAMPSPVSPY